MPTPATPDDNLDLTATHPLYIAHDASGELVKSMDRLTAQLQQQRINHEATNAELVAIKTALQGLNTVVTAQLPTLVTATEANS